MIRDLEEEVIGLCVVPDEVRRGMGTSSLFLLKIPVFLYIILLLYQLEYIFGTLLTRRRRWDQSGSYCACGKARDFRNLQLEIGRNHLARLVDLPTARPTIEPSI
jgi:hypothetical protein